MSAYQPKPPEEGTPAQICGVLGHDWIAQTEIDLGVICRYCWRKGNCRDRATYERIQEKGGRLPSGASET